jgi:addiction module RelE/StbE family toxin
VNFEIKLSKRAKTDLLNITNYYSEISPKYYEKVFNNLDSSILNLEKYPEIGKEYKSKRLLVCGNYLIVYKILVDKIIIVAIPHSTQNF